MSARKMEIEWNGSELEELTMKETNDRTYFVDCLLPNGLWEYGSIGSPRDAAEDWAMHLRQGHPDWLVEVNSVEKKGM